MNIGRTIQRTALVAGSLLLATTAATAKQNGYSANSIIDCWNCRSACETAYDLCLTTGRGTCEIELATCFDNCSSCDSLSISVFEPAYVAAAEIHATIESTGGGGLPTSVLTAFPHVEAELINAAQKIDARLARAEEELAEAVASEADPMDRRRLVDLLVTIERARAAVGEEGRACLAETASR